MIQFGTVIAVYNYPETYVIQDLVDDVREGHNRGIYNLNTEELNGNWEHWQLFHGEDSDNTPCKFLVTDKNQVSATKRRVSSSRINYLHELAEDRAIEYEA